MHLLELEGLLGLRLGAGSVFNVGEGTPVPEVAQVLLQLPQGFGRGV